MKFPPSATSAVVLGALRLLRATWRFHRVGPPPGSREDSDGRQGEDRDRAPRSARRAGPLPPAIYVCWHEHQLPLAIFHARQGVVALTSRHRDGETVAKVLHRLGYRTARGSSSRGGAAGLRQMVRNGRQGRSLAFTPDGPRGPPRRCKPGTIVAAAMTGLPIVPVGVAVTRGWRLSSWDRFLIPAPGSSIFVSYGPALSVPPRAAGEPDEWTPRLQEAIEREVRRCERKVRRPDGQARESTGLGEAESRLRAAWRKGPRPLLRAAGVLFGVGSELRHFAYDVGLIETRRPPIPVASIGGLTVGGSGKTPVTSELAGWLAARGVRVAVVTRGFPDEFELHQELLPAAVVVGHPDRLQAVRRAAAAGARVALLDDGFQHRRLARGLEVVLVDLDALLRTSLRRLPAGPFRERFGAVARADSVVITRRGSGSADAARLADWLARRLRVPVASLVLEPAGLRPANAGAAAETRPDPTVALTAIMKPRLFFRQLAEGGWPDLERVVLPDHGVPGAELLSRVVRRAGTLGIVCTRKDAVKLRDRVPADVPLWYLADRIRWEMGRDALRDLVCRWAAAGGTRAAGERDRQVEAVTGFPVEGAEGSGRR